MAVGPDLDELVESVSSRTGYRFSDPAILQRAVTHASTGGPGGNYERLEFLGDRVLGLIVAQMLFRRFPEADQGELSRRFNFLVSAETCARVAELIGLPELIVTGAEIKSLKGRKRSGIRADVMESVLAAIHLDGGLEAVRPIVEKLWLPLALASDAGRRDPKTELQEWAHRETGKPPEYQIDGRTGPDHDPVFEVTVSVAGYEPETATGRSKREAEQAAATALLLREGVWRNEEPWR